MEPATACKKPASQLPLPPALFLVRARSRASRVADLDLDAAAAAAWPPPGPPDTPPRRSPVTVPFIWEDAPGKPKAPAVDPVLPVAGEGDHDTGHKEEACPVPLKLPPRLQHMPSPPAAADDASLLSAGSPKAVLQGPYYYYGCAGGGGGAKRPPRRLASRAAAFRRTPSTGVGLFSRSRTWTRSSKPTAAAAGNDAPWCSPAASSSASSSSSSFMSAASCFRDDHGHGGHRRPDYSEEEVDDGAVRESVRITRLRRNRSLPSITTSNLWASIRRSVKQITPWR